MGGHAMQPRENRFQQGGEILFDVERLLGKMVGEVIGKSGLTGAGKASKLGGLGADSGLMALIGLGVGAYEILQ